MATVTMTVESPPVAVGSNQGKIASQHLGWLRPTARDTPLEEMRERLRQDGYLFVKNLIPRKDVLRVRKDYFQRYAPTGILEPGSDPEAGVFNGGEAASAHGGIGAGELPPTDLQVQTMTDAHKTPEYLAFLEHADLRGFVRALMGWDREVLLRRTMLRHNVPGGLSTAVHYDKLFLRGGEAYFLTAWVPIGDISQTGGGLMYLSDSTSLGRSIEDDFTQRAAQLTPEERVSAFNVNMEKYGQLSQNAAEFGDAHRIHRVHRRHEDDDGSGSGDLRRWLVADYEAGDVVFHDPYMIHTSTRNEDAARRIRLSTDLRFYREGSDLDARWMKFWTPGDGL
ncbi:Phytanoyl-CoA dioxygenase [Purpureocillium takamizusanense]|uniref:Phytanoyl-CoA dioxygenase n=1 Tax=Purpureocillium takamizusanense TaxID=2060973 RepID=A0A9Q8V5D5_9HYPO|nr:Phytanoyl-CoA dioxygenase [Purpureocillium takamizusanense]UNI13563.1 Phytanoyl-CoA dioxygenase [Purpureocillium takamizusanense]